MIKAVLFDFDGTLLDSEAMVIHCFSHLFEKYRRIEDFTREYQLEVFGPPLHTEMVKLFPGHDPEQMIREYREFQSTLPGTGVVHLIPHAKEVLEELRKKGIRMAVISSRITASCRMWMKEFDLERYFELILGQEAFDKPKPDPEGIVKAYEAMGLLPEECIYAGDNASDVIAAKRAGVFSVGFVSNREKAGEILDSRPDLVIYDLEDILKCI